MGVEERREFISLCLGTVGMQLSMKVDRSNKPAIARIWRGRVKRERADEYQKYNYEFGIKPLIEKAMGVQALRDDREFETEFMTISYWESIEAMSRFTGGDPTQIHHLQRDAEFLIEIPRRVQILKIYESHGRIG
jgi:heme-degrading monooxygenase HmoA